MSIKKITFFNKIDFATFLFLSLIEFLLDNWTTHIVINIVTRFHAATKLFFFFQNLIILIDLVYRLHKSGGITVDILAVST